MKVKTFRDAEKRYGEIKNRVWSNEKHWMSLVRMPEWFLKTVTNSFTHKPCRAIYLNEDMKQPLLDALENVFLAGVRHELITFDGCFSIRPVRGFMNAVSAHSYGLALDFNAADNQLGQTPSFSNEFVNCFKKTGFSWGGDFPRIDGMHFSYAWE